MIIPFPFFFFFYKHFIIHRMERRSSPLQPLFYPGGSPEHCSAPAGVPLKRSETTHPSDLVLCQCAVLGELPGMGSSASACSCSWSPCWGPRPWGLQSHGCCSSAAVEGQLLLFISLLKTTSRLLSLSKF